MRGRSWGLRVITAAERTDRRAAFPRITGFVRKMLSGETRLPGFPSIGWERATARVPGRWIAPGGSGTM
jgi:hypothetical protein